MKHFPAPLVAVAVAIWFSGPPLKADDRHVRAVESGGDVIFFHEGSIDLTGFSGGLQFSINNSENHPLTSVYRKTGAEKKFPRDALRAPTRPKHGIVASNLDMSTEFL